MKAIRVTKTGGPEVLRLEETPVPKLGPGQARVRVAACGVNFIDVYQRTGLYPLALPFTPGMEGAGVVEAVGAGVEEPKPGDRVAWAMQLGGYAEQAIVDAWKLVPVPAGLAQEQAAAAMLQGMTAHYLTRSTWPLRAGETAVVHAAAGGVGLLLVQMAKQIGATVVGVVSTEEKARLARIAGAQHVVVTASEDFVAVAKEVSSGRGADVVYDSVGRDTFERSLQCLRPRGMLVSFGQSSGPIAAFDPRILAAGSLFLTRPGLGHYTATREELLQRSGDVFRGIAQGTLSLRIDRTLPLAQAADAHRALQGRETKGKVLLLA